MRKFAVYSIVTVAVLIILVVSFLIISQKPSEYSPPQSQSQSKQQNVPRAILDVYVYETSGYWRRNNDADLPEYIITLELSVENTGNRAAENVQINVRKGAENYSQDIIASLQPSEVHTNLFTVTLSYDSTTSISMEASCSDSSDFSSISLAATLPREFDESLCELFITPEETNLVTLKNQILKDKFFLTPNWIALRDWVGNNIKYTYDSDVHGKSDYWQLPKETIQLRTGDCEDFAILLCSLLRADGWSTNNVYVIVGEQNGNYHAWVKIIWNGISYNIEPQGNVLCTLLGDFLSLSGYRATCYFNDVQFSEIG